MGSTVKEELCLRELWTQQMDRLGDSLIPPKTFFAGGISIDM